MPNYAERRVTHQMRVVELRFGASVPGLLRRLRAEGLNGVQVARRLDIPTGTARRWLVRFGLDDASLIRSALRAATPACAQRTCGCRQVTAAMPAEGSSR